MPQRNLNGNIQLDPLEYEITRRIRLAGSLTRNDLADMLDISRSKLTKSASALR